MLAMARVLVGEPNLLLVDEPSEGLAPMIVSEIYAILSELKQAGRAILLVEQNVAQALTVCERFVAMERGRLALEGDARPNQIASSCCRSWRSEGTAPFKRHSFIDAQRRTGRLGRKDSNPRIRRDYSFEMSRRVPRSSEIGRLRLFRGRAANSR